ncbi:MAG: arabinogalactan endo-beta-1,4-galactanase [Anaerocolumna sp.]
MEFLKGMDISFLPEMLDRGGKFLDQHGSQRNDVFDLLKENGVNSIRLRIWNEPENVPQSKGYCNLDHTIKMAKKIKAYGMSFFLDFHYSDWWADPSKQEKPKAWKDLSFEELKVAVYEYTRDVLLTLEEENVYPDMVQIGNEIRSGMLFPEGEVPNYKELVALINAGIQGVRAADGERHQTKIVIHLDQGGRYFYLKDWFDQAFAAGLLDFDIIGVSYYPFWHGTFTEFKDTLVNLVERYKKPVVIAETAHAWRLTDEGFIGKQQEEIAGFLATPEDQYKVIDLVMNITASLKEEMGIGIYYWEPVVLPFADQGGWNSNMGVFHEDGRALPALTCFQFDRSKFHMEKARNQVAKVYHPIRRIALRGSDIRLPETIKVLFYDGSCRELPVLWKDFDKELDGVQVIEGAISSTGQGVSIELELVQELKKSHNFVVNGDFNEGLDTWKVHKKEEQVVLSIRPDFIEPFPAPPIQYVYIESPINFEMDISKDIVGLEPGRYRCSVDYRGTNTTGVEVRLFTQTKENETKEEVIHPTDEDWITYSISDIVVTDGKLKLGLLIKSPPIFGKIKNFTLTRQD